jgi:peptidoglycan hydrolase-like protein with peptidoglycan-binding domain
MQEFLEDEWFYVGDPSGVYDSKTTEAVNAFQAFYKEEILDPGGYLAPTGYWYPATRRKANALVCE